uniref:Sushi domain-containing protein n=1 Tax=Sinocyclocheilus rhinocerous TaxID=307959 RepID=A0A673LP46_9TELE
FGLLKKPAKHLHAKIKINPEGKTIFRAGESIFFSFLFFLVMTVSKKCGPPPHVNNADTVEMTKKECNTGERVEYMCFNKYTLDSHPAFSKYLTCQQGEWRGNIKCLSINTLHHIYHAYTL